MFFIDSGTSESCDNELLLTIIMVADVCLLLSGLDPSF